MRYIFFDLETSDKNFVGQILNYCFVLTDSKFEQKTVFRGTIRLSKTQIPDPAAIFANKINIKDHIDYEESHSIETVDGVEHINLNMFSERDSFNMVKEWLDSQVKKFPAMLVGHNSDKFDVPFLRTSMIRNGINPYFNSNMLYGDTKNFLKSCAARDGNILNDLLEGNIKTPFKLENACRTFGILDDDKVQIHESYYDVLDTIELVKKLHDLGFDISEQKVLPKKSKLLKLKSAKYEDGIFHSFEEKLMYPYSINKKYCLFLDVEKCLNHDFFRAELDLDTARELAVWVKNDSGFFEWEEENDKNKFIEMEKISSLIYSSTNLSIDNYFPEKTCDIEQHIYMMPFGDMNDLCKAIEQYEAKGSTNIQLKGNYAKKLFNRFKLNHIEEKDEKYFEVLGKYYFHRYGGVMKTSRFNNDSVYEAGTYSEDFHETLDEYYKKIKDILDESKDNHSIEIFSSLKNYFDEINKIYSKLIEIKRVKKE
jgi:hypothetical protein